MDNASTAKVSIVMRTRDRPIFLKRALDSVLGQTFSDWLLVIVNDGGSRNSIENVVAPRRQRLGPRLLILDFLKSPGTGIGAPLNLGIKASESELIAVHDDDDSWEPGFLEATVQFLHREAKYGACVARTRMVHERVEADQIVAERSEIYNDWQNHAISLFRLAENNTFAPISLLFRRSVLAEIGYRRDDLGPLEDWEFNLRLASRYPIALLPEVLANYHQRVPSSAHGTNANFFTSSADLYGRLDIEIRNELLRRDLAAGKFGLGFLVNMARSHGHLFQKMHGIGSSLQELRSPPQPLN